jgi:protein SCO1/2
MTTESRQLRRRDWPVLVLAGLVALIALLVVLYVTTAPRAVQSNADAGRFSHFAQGVDDVTLVDSSGERVRWADLNGRPRLVFFGFTRCPEICPTTVAELSAAIDSLGQAAGDVEVDFISVDPARDTPEHLALYFRSFGPRFRGFSGGRPEIDRLVASFHAFYEYVPVEGEGYTVSHTAITYLINPRGEVVDIIGYGNPHERTVAQLRAFLN